MRTKTNKVNERERERERAIATGQTVAKQPGKIETLTSI